MTRTSPHARWLASGLCCPKRYRNMLLACAACVSVEFTLAADASAQESQRHEAHKHSELRADASLSLADTLAIAVDRHPQGIEMESRAIQANAWRERGRSWIADSPALSLHYQTDEYSDDNGLEEFQAGIELTLWRLGERTATQQLGKAYGQEASLARAALRWRVAGQLRHALWRIALADNNAALARRSLAIARRLLAAVERRYALGDLARTDLLLAQSKLLEQETALLEAEAVQVDAQRAYTSLTGISSYPQDFNEKLSRSGPLDETHPLLAFSQAELRRAEAAHRYALRAAKQNATLSFGPRRERPANDIVVEDSLGVSLRIPFGGGAHRKTEIAAARRAVAAAEARRDRLRRELRLQLHETEHQLHVAKAAAALAAKRAQIAQHHSSMGDTAFRQGESSLPDLLNLQGLTAAAEQQASRLQIEVQRNIALYNQARGELP